MVVTKGAEVAGFGVAGTWDVGAATCMGDQ